MSVINTNYLSLVAQNNLNKSQSSLGTAIERLSSGLRINSAKDDAAGQAIANRMTAQIRGMTQAARNANDGISLAQTAEGNLNEINNNLQRIRELAVQGANATNGKSDAESIKAEITQLLKEINRIATGAKFNETELLNDNDKTLTIQVGANSTEHDTITITLMNATVDGLGLKLTRDGDGTVTDIGIEIVVDADDGFDAEATAGSFKAYLDKIDTALQKVDSARSGLGAIQNRFQSTISNLNNTINNLSASRSRIEDADYAVEVSNMTRAQILQQAGTSVLAQANQVPQTVLSLLG